jgi:glyoxylase-like metal-dependent hydrolase (beta-lactamase superfamily II)
MEIGHLRVDPVSDGAGFFDPGAFRGTTPEMWANHKQFLTDDGKIELALGGFLIRGAGDRVILVDNGIGPTPPGSRFDGGKLMQSLATYGLKAEDITDMVFSHLHFDHYGWSTQEGVNQFPNATFRCDERDWAHFVGPDERATKALKPIQDRLETWSGSGTLLPGIDVQAAPGHTPGSTILVLSSGTERGMLLGDVVHCPVELVDDEWGGLGDVDPELAKRTKNALALELEGTNTPVSAAHFPGMRWGRLLPAQGKRQWMVG